MCVSEETLLRASCDTNPLEKRKNVLMNSCWFQLNDNASAKILNQTHLETHSSHTSDTKLCKNTTRAVGELPHLKRVPEQMME